MNVTTDFTTYADLDAANKADGHYCRQPAELVEARKAMNRAWKRHAEIVEYEFHEKDGEPDPDRINEAVKVAYDAEAWYYDLYDQWMRQFERQWSDDPKMWAGGQWATS